MMPRFIVVALAILVALGRLTIETRHNLPTWGLSYEAFAHLYVGGLIGAGLATRSWFCWFLVIALTVWEVIAVAWL